ncbi:histidinol-phosphatase HisJ family protein [Neobacillus sp. OS1-2]|uniref:histidinol-phosphatase HisJ family protein n=1 Tax=Neobacillus sp. OS1-2 TaxID=3070680 RepID=UPI0027E159C9|nr:histidinol-phosphatase HisJ family protein [Neobacillus sp. OS1-2]WML41457.1 histidinol-phosphatase HisJ family protein [Neobacillus sp. OS1-2]
MYLMDYHHHTNHSFDSTAIMEEVCRRALENHINEICFTEHFSVNPLAPTYGHMNFAKYFSEIRDCQEQFHGRLTIKAGIELCEPHLLMDQYAQTLRTLHLDFILGSVHNINNQKLRLVGKEHHQHAYQLYFEELFKMVSVADIDVIAHFDLMKRYSYKEFGNYLFEDYQEIIEQILKKSIERNIGIEINTSGLRTSLKETLPSMNIIRRYRELGGEILTIGSDSHKAETVGANLVEAYRMAKECGFHTIYKFDRRKAIPVEL